MSACCFLLCATGILANAEPHCRRKSQVNQALRSGRLPTLPQFYSARYDLRVNQTKTRTLKLTVAYDGARFKGWQRGNGRTVQSTLEEALGLSVGRASRGAVRTPIGVTADGAGRTDAGVHAEGQVASTRLPSTVEPDLLLEAVSRLLPHDVTVRSVEPSHDRFHARYHATAKTYRYRIMDGPAGIPFLHRFSWRVADSLDLSRMKRASEVFVGEHDFAAFTADKGKKDKTRSVYSIGFERPEIFGGFPLDIVFRGKGFLWNQVRRMTCALVAAGRGEADAASLDSILASHDRSIAPAPAPARGLTLVSVEY